MVDHFRTFVRTTPDSEECLAFIQSFIKLPCAHFWRCYGSAMFLEFGALHENGVRRDGSARNPEGEWSLYLDYNWRIEGKRLVWCGSEDEEADCDWVFQKLIGTKVHQCTFTGRLLELDLEFENRLHILTLATSAGHPGWSLTKSLPNGYEALCSTNGHLVFDTLVNQNA